MFLLFVIVVYFFTFIYSISCWTVIMVNKAFHIVFSCLLSLERILWLLLRQHSHPHGIFLVLSLLLAR